MRRQTIHFVGVRMRREEQGRKNWGWFMKEAGQGGTLSNGRISKDGEKKRETVESICFERFLE